METFISIIKYYPLNTREESFGIGIIMFNEKMGVSRLKFSEERINSINKFYGFKKSVLINETIKNLQNKIFTYDELNYLSKYENGSIRYSVPQIVNTDDFDSKFNYYYNFYIADKNELNIQGKVNYTNYYFKNALRENLRKDTFIEKHLNIAFTIKREMVKNLMTSNMEIDFIGINGTIYCGQAPNLSTKSDNAENILTKTLFLYNIFKGLYGKNNKYNPQDCKIILNRNEKEKRENKDIINTIEGWQRTEGYGIIIAENEKHVIEIINSEIKEKNIIPFDNWIGENLKSEN